MLDSTPVTTPETIHTFSTLEEARELAILLSAACPNPSMVCMGLAELLINAVEHGNLGITYAEKVLLKQEQRWEEEVSRRLSLPDYAYKKAHVKVTHNRSQIVFTITDQGKGFDWQQYLDFDPERAMDPNGRGISMAKMISFDSVEYIGIGNRVMAIVRLKHLL